MPADRLLIDLLRSLQVPQSQRDVSRLLSTATGVLTTLSNPLNLTLISAHILLAPAIWNAPDGLRTCVQVMGIFHSAAATILRHEEETAQAERDGKNVPQPQPGQGVIGGGLSREKWVSSVIHGADQRSPRWKHLLVIAGVLSGFEGQRRRGFERSLRTTVEHGLVTAINLAVAEARSGEDIGAQCTALVVTWMFELLSEQNRALVDYDQLLPVLVTSAFFSGEGFYSGAFLVNIEKDLEAVQGNMLTWSPETRSFLKIQDILSRPMIPAMGLVSKLLAHTVAHVKNPWLVQSALDDLLEFSRSLVAGWRQLKLSEIDAAEESIFFDNTAMSSTLPDLWRLLRSAMFSTIIVLQAIVSRLLRDESLAKHHIAPTVAIQTLSTLRNISFISARQGANSSSQHNFIYLTAIDVLAAYPKAAENFLVEIRPSHLGQIPSHPLDRTLDLFFLNAAENFTLILTPNTNDTLLIAATTPYLAAGGNNHLLEIFEAAHSVMLAVLSTPSSAELAAKHLPFYVDALFRVFPQNLSPRQFRLAFRTLLSISAAPAPVATSHPDLSATLLELLHHRATHASDALLPASTSDSDSEPMDERTAIVLTLIDCLPYLPPPLLEEWLPLTAQLLPAIKTHSMLKCCQQRFWETLSMGEMDPERSMVCVAWWGTRGGKEMVIGLAVPNAGDGSVVMSGALPVATALASRGQRFDGKL